MHAIDAVPAPVGTRRKASGREPAFFVAERKMQTMTIQEQIEAILATAEPSVEVLRVDPVGRDLLRIYIDHPDGVSLDLCTRVTHALGEVREHYAVEVSSPGAKRPLTRPAHFVRFVGKHAKVTLRAPQGDRITWRGEIVAADDATVTLGTDQGMLELEHGAIKQANLTGE